ncbi:MAG: hypothetical protein NVSMB56_11600 [Pyrinomonadaceae bacterium]
MVLYAPLVVAQYAISMHSVNFLWHVILWLIESLGYSLLAGALIYGTVIYLGTGMNPTVAECYRYGAKRFGIVLGCNILTGLIAGLGFMLLIIPGIIFMLMFSLVIPIAVIEDRGIKDAMKRSTELTAGYRWRIFGALFIFWLIITGVTLLMSGAVLGSSSESFVSSAIRVLTLQLLNSTSIIIPLFIYLGILSISNANPIEIVHADATLNQAR